MVNLKINCFFKGNHTRKWSLDDLFKTFFKSLATLTGRHGCTNQHRTEIYQSIENKLPILTGSEKCFYASCRYQLHLSVLSIWISRKLFSRSRHTVSCNMFCANWWHRICRSFIYQSSARAFVYSGVWACYKIGSQFVLIYMMYYVRRNVIGSGQWSHVKTHVIVLRVKRRVTLQIYA